MKKLSNTSGIRCANKLLKILPLLSLILLVACRPDSRDVYNRPINFKDYKGKWLVINYFAPWCKPCIKELPQLNALYLFYKNKIMVFGVSYDTLKNEDIIAFANKTGITFPILTSFPLQKFTTTTIDAIPITFIISPDGKLNKILPGPQTLETFEKALGFANQKKQYRIEFRVLKPTPS